MDKFTIYKLIDEQLKNNDNKSLFYKESTLKLHQSLAKILLSKQDEIRTLMQDSYDFDDLLEYITQKVINVFINANQYLHFNNEDYINLKNIYYHLITKIISAKLNESSLFNIMFIHYENLRNFLITSNKSSIFNSYYLNEMIPYVECSEYTFSLQLKVLNLDLSTIKQPILDIGCGENANLVNYFISKGFKAYGFNRYLNQTNSNLTINDWFNYDYGEDKWGTIIAHLSFSNHFLHHHNKVDGDYALYAQTYLKIMQSLKKDGSFIYTPSLIFIEDIISSNLSNFSIERYNIMNEYYTTHLKRL